MTIKKGFTLAEVMITLGVLGILAAVTIPAVMSVSPNTNKVMFKKAYLTFEKTISEMINDDRTYPATNTGDTDDNPKKIGIAQGFHKWDDKDALGVPTNDDKFCYLFAQKVNVVGALHCNSTTDNNSNATLNNADNTDDKPSFTTSDGMIWYISHDIFGFDDISYNYVIVDVNGTKTPNCLYDAATCAKPDRFKLKVRYDGRIQTSDPEAVKILTDPTNNR